MKQLWARIAAWFDRAAEGPVYADSPLDRCVNMVRAVAAGTIPTDDEGYSQAEARRILKDLDGPN